MISLRQGDADSWVLQPWVPLAVLALVLVTAFGLASTLHRLEDAHHQGHFDVAALERLKLLEMGVHVRFRPIQHIATVFSVRKAALRDGDFHLLADSIPLAKSPAILALQWIPREATAPDRETYPVRYSYYPGGTKPAALDHDLTDDPLLRRALRADSSEPGLYIGRWERRQGQVRFRALVPVFDFTGGEPLLLGFVSGLYRVDRLVAEALCPDETDAIQLIVSDASSPTSDAFMCRQGRVQIVEAGWTPHPGGRQLTRYLAVNGSRWNATAIARPGDFAASNWTFVVVMVGGFAMGALLALLHRFAVTREAQVRRLVKRRTRELAFRTEQLQQRADELQAVNSELEQFAYVASHDLKAPLRAVSQLASWIEEETSDRLDEDSREKLQLMRERVLRMDCLIEGLLAYSRAGRVTREGLKPVPLHPLLEELAGELLLPDGFRVQIQEKLPSLLADPLHLRQIFQNLIINVASHHDRPEQGTVWVRAEEEKRRWRLEIADDGPGIPPQERERVFRIFTSLGRPVCPGHTGIGLAIVKKLVQGYGGTIDVTDNRPRGALFRIWWPKSRLPHHQAG